MKEPIGTKTSINSKIIFKKSLTNNDNLEFQFDKLNTTSLPNFDGQSNNKIPFPNMGSKMHTLTDYKYKVLLPRIYFIFLNILLKF
jgi:hypothetical protein